MSQGIDIRENDGSGLIFRVSLKDSNGNILGSGTTNLRLYEIQPSGNLYSYDWSDDSFKSGTLISEHASMTHQKGNAETTDTGIWTYLLTSPTGFTNGNIYITQVINSGASPQEQEREFQFDFSSAFFDVNTTQINGNATSAENLRVSTLSMITGQVDNSNLTPSTTQFDTSLDENETNQYVGRVLIFTSGSLIRQACIIQAYSLQSGLGRFTVTQLTSAPSNGDTIIIV